MIAITVLALVAEAADRLQMVVAVAAAGMSALSKTYPNALLQGVASAGEPPKPDGPRNARLRHALGKPKLLFGLEEAICLAPSVAAGATTPLSVVVHVRLPTH